VALPLPQKKLLAGITVPAAGVPEQGDAVIVCILDAGTGLVPVREAAQIVKPEKLVAATPTVFPPVALPPISAVMCTYPVTPEPIICGEKEGNIFAPATPGLLNVDNKVAVAALNVAEVEYQHLRLSTSVAV
jgi:hypothetical protein